MKRTSMAIAIAAILAASGALAQTPPATTAKDKTTMPAADHADHNKAQLSNDDEKFLKEFAQANAAEVEAGKLAEQQAQHPDVKAFGKHMVEEHSKSIKMVETVATNHNIDVKSKPDLMHKAKGSMLDGKRGAEFDAAYIKAQIDDHEKVAEMLQKEIREGRDANVKKLASDSLPHVQEHLAKAKALQTKLSKR